MPAYDKQVKINARKKVTINAYKGKVWLHFRDEPKSKTLSFSKDDFIALLEKMPKIQKRVKECGASIMKKEKKTKKKYYDSTDSDSEVSYADEDSD